MRLASILGRTCPSCAFARAVSRVSRAPPTTPHPATGARWFSAQPFGRQGPRQWRHHGSNGPSSQRARSGARSVFILGATATISGAAAAAATGLGAAAAFVELSRRKNADGDDKDTGEQRMPTVSRAELRQRGLRRRDGDGDGDAQGIGRAWAALRRTAGYLDVYVLEPVLTALRFLYLVAIFVPVVMAAPAVWYGSRDPKRGNERTGSLWWYELLVKSMELAGPAFIKLGQWAASRTDVFPNEMCDIMSKLHSNAPAHSMAHTEKILVAAFGLEMADIFEEFGLEPLGVGAIAQVYRARLRPGLAAARDADLDLDLLSARSLTRDVMHNVETVLKSSPKRVPPSDNYVAVKVIHPGAERTVRRDLRIMGFFAAAINAIPTMEWLSLPDEVAQFGDMMHLQLDLRTEAANLTRFRQNFKDRSTAWFPYPYTQLTTRSVLVEEFAQGMPLADFIDCGGGVFQHDIAGEGLDAFLRMLLLDNFVHADLHPGNIMVRFYQPSKPDLHIPKVHHHRHGTEKPHPDDRQDVTEQVLSRLRPLRDRRDPSAWLAELRAIDAEGYRPQLIFIDTGLVTELSAPNRANFLDLFRAIAEFDGHRAGLLMCERCRQPDAVVDKALFADKMQALIRTVKDRTLALGNIKIGDLLQEVMAMVRDHHVRLEGDFVNVVISILLLEGIGRSLNPDADLLSASLPILRQLGVRGGAEMARQGDLRLLVLWAGLETRRFLHASVEDVERCVKYDLLSPNV